MNIIMYKKKKKKHKIYKFKAAAALKQSCISVLHTIFRQYKYKLSLTYNIFIKLKEVKLHHNIILYNLYIYFNEKN